MGLTWRRAGNVLYIVVSSLKPVSLGSNSLWHLLVASSMVKKWPPLFVQDAC